MRRFLSAGITLSALTLALASTQVAQAQIANAGFETPVVGNGNFQYNPAGASFTFTGQSGISGNNSGFTSGNPAAPEGSQVAFIQNQGSFSQTFTSSIVSPISFSFLAARRGNFGPSIETFNVLFNGVTVGTFAPTATAYSLFTTSLASTVVGNNTLTFTGTTSGGDATAFVDQIQNPNTSAPEPGSLALLLPVMGTVGMILRRRKK